MALGLERVLLPSLKTRTAEGCKPVFCFHLLISPSGITVKVTELNWCKKSVRSEVGFWLLPLPNLCGPPCPKGMDIFSLYKPEDSLSSRCNMENEALLACFSVELIWLSHILHFWRHKYFFFCSCFYICLLPPPCSGQTKRNIKRKFRKRT